MKLAKRSLVISMFGAIIACSSAAPPDTGGGEDNQTGGPGVPKAAGADKGGGGGNPTPTNPPPPSSSCGTDDFTKPDLSTLTACGNGKGHCFDKTKFELSAIA